MRQQVGGKKEPRYRAVLRCPCFWGNGHPGLCIRFQMGRRFGLNNQIAGRLTQWSLRWPRS